MDRLLNVSRLSLGTAQLGMRYGAVNVGGDPGLEGACAVLDAAWTAGISCIDTAPAYGEAEYRLGIWRAQRQVDPVLVSKLPKLDKPESPAVIEAMFARSTDDLGVQHIDGYICHSATNLRDSAVLTAFETLRCHGRISRFGTTLYSPCDLEFAMTVRGLGMLQLPLSLVNSRFARDESIVRAAARGVLVFVRSVYLQGVLLVPPERLPPWLSALAEPLRKLHALANESHIDVARLALAAVNAVPGVHSIIVGAETPHQLAQSIAALRAPPPEPALLEEAWSLFKNVPDELSDSARWPNR
jgi:aryl-alcohol dehydrogenase-like predicted oxidoreductase